MRIGLFGGTFNPIHQCHLQIAKQTQSRLKLDRIIFIPSGDPPHKAPGSLAPAPHRIEMVRLAIANNPTFTVSDVETSRSAKSYSIDTVQALRAECGPEAELFFIIGLDAFLEFPSWRQPKELLGLCHFVVVSRAGAAFATLASSSLLPPLDPTALAALDARKQDRYDIPCSANTGLTLLALPPCDASASEIRNRIRNRLSLANQLPASVESYIISFRLYQEGSDRTGVEG